MLILVSLLLFLLIAAAGVAIAVRWLSLARAVLRIGAYMRERLRLQRSVAVTLIIVTGVLLGMTAYNWEVTHSQEALFQQVQKQNVLDRMLNEAPGFPFFLDSVESPRGRDLHALWIWLKRMDLLGGDEAESIGAPESRFACLAKLVVAPTSSAIKGEEERCPGVNPIEGADWGKGVSTVEVLVAIAAQLGANSSGIARTDEGSDGQPKTRDEVRGTIARWLAASLARQPNHGTAFGAADTFSDLDDDLAHDPETSCGFVRWLHFGEPCVLERPKQESLGKVLQALHERVKPIAPGGAFAQVHDFWESKPTELAELATTPDRAAQLEMVLVFERALAQTLLLDRSVVEAANKLDFWIGYEQCAIVILATVLALLLVAAGVQEIPQIASTSVLSSLLNEAASPTQDKSAQQDEVGEHGQPLLHVVFDHLLLRAGTPPDWPLRSSQAFRLVQIARDEADPRLLHARTLAAAVQEEATAIDDRRWFFGWALAAIPALGFLGTVRGILAAIGGVGGMADAETRLSSAVAIGNVSGSLSLAFSTTMLALIAVLVLGLADQWQVASQRKRLDEIEEGLRTMAGVK